MKYQVIRLTPESNLELREKVYSLRYSIYCDEMNLPLGRFNSLQDDYDKTSINFLLLLKDEDIGTFRFTTLASSSLEIMSQSNAWTTWIRQKISDKNYNVAEVTRLMIVKQHRKTAALYCLLNALLEEAYLQEVDLVLIAEKEKKKPNLYSRLGAKYAPVPNANYKINDHVLGQYSLMYFDKTVPLSKADAANKLMTMMKAST